MTDDASTDVDQMEPGSASTGSPVLWRAWCEMTKDEKALTTRQILVARGSGMTWAALAKAFPGVSDSTIRRLWRESQWEQTDLSPEGIKEARHRQAAELRAMNELLWVKIEDLESRTDPDTGLPVGASVDELTKLQRELRGNQDREAKLLGLDAAMKVEHSGRIELNHATAELEALVAELAGGGMVMSLPVDAELVEEA